MSCFPFFADIEGAEVLIIGGGAVAARKARELIEYGARITIIAPVISQGCREMNAERIERRFEPGDIETRWAFVIAASDDAELNRTIAADCRRRRIPVNVVNSPEDGTFVFPALLQKGKLSVGVCTSGASPTAAAWVRDRIEEILPDDFDAILEKLMEERKQLIDREPDRKKRSELLRRMFYASIEKADR